MKTNKPHKIRNRRWPFQFIYAPLVVLVILLTTQCIEEYNPNLNVDVDLLTINGSIVRGQEEQTIVISRSTPVDATQYNPVENCDVVVIDDKNNTFLFEELFPGKYYSTIDMTYLDIGAKFKLSITTPNKNVYESDYEEIQDCPPVDDLYFLEESAYSISQNRDMIGLRLNLDLHAHEGYTDYYRWKIDETWEYRSRNNRVDRELVGVKVDTLNGGVLVPVYHNFRQPDSLHYCWRSDRVNELYSSSTINLVSNGKKRVPLHFVFEDDERLFVRFSCLVSQYSLNEGAFKYWQNKAVEIKESGGMYFSQPSQTLSNIKNINNDQETVLGYFWTASKQQKRIFFDGPLYSSYYNIPCRTDEFFLSNYYSDPDYWGEFEMINPDDFPVFIVDSIFIDKYDNIFIIPTTTDHDCFDCRTRGGTITRPDYW